MKGLLEKILAEGREKVPMVLEEIQREFDIRQDIIARPDKVSFSFRDNGTPAIRVGERDFGLTDWSTSQLLQRSGIPMGYYEKMKECAQFPLVKLNVETMLPVISAKGLLIRTVEEKARGILSTSYKRMDAGLIFQSFAKSCLDEGYMPLAGRNTISRYHLKFVKDKIISLANDDVVYGLSVTTSDYGAASLKIEMFVMRVACTNMMTAMDLLSKVHLGSRIGTDTGDDGFIFSERTENFDSLTIASAISDVVKAARDQENTITEMVNSSAMDSIDLKGFLENLRKKSKLTKAEAERAQALYNNESLGFEYLPSEKNRWRLSNVISLMAKDSDPDRGLELENLSFQVLLPKAA